MRPFRFPALRSGLTSLAMAALLLGVPAAHADNYEARWSTRPVVGVALLEEEGATRDELGVAGGASLSFAYGITNQLDLGAELVALSTLMPTFDAAIMSNGFIARGDFRRRSATTLLLLGPTWRFGALGWTPVVSAGAGGGVRLRSRGSFSRTGLVPDDKVELAALDLAVSAKAGIERRINRPTLQETLAALFGAAIVSPSSARSDVPEDVAQVALKLLDRKRANRFATAEEARAALLSCAAAPRDGRADLAALLLDRFGGRVADNARAPTLLSGVAPSSPASAGLLARGTPAADASSDVRAQRLASRPWASRKWALAGLGLLVALAAMLAVLALSRDWRARPAAPPVTMPAAGSEKALRPQSSAEQPSRANAASTDPATHNVAQEPSSSPVDTMPKAPPIAVPPASTKAAPPPPASPPRRNAPSRAGKSSGDSSGIIDLRVE